MSWAVFLIGGFFVGFGTKLGNGFTSGHGICGLAWFSKRSLVVVCTFMSAGALTTYLTQKSTMPFPKDVFAFLPSDPQEQPIRIWSTFGALLSGFVALLAFIAPSLNIQPDDGKSAANARAKLAPAAIAGMLFLAGLYVSQMVYPVQVFGFLNVGLIFQSDWDATLMFVMGGGLVISVLSYQAIEGCSVVAPRFLACHPLSKPLALAEESNFYIPCKTIIDYNLVLGAMTFGLGWGISGLCPGPTMVLAGVGHSWVLVCYWPAFFVGCYLAQQVADVSFSRVEEHTRDSKAVTSTRPFNLKENCSYGAMSETSTR